MSSCSYLGQYDTIQRDDRCRDSQKHRSQSGRSRVLGFKVAAFGVISCDEADDRASLARDEGRTIDGA
jgi:hypothetical protein